jgi:hypothetical protein
MNASQIRELIIFGYKKEKKADMISAGLRSEIFVNPDKSIARVDLYHSNGTILDEKKVYTVALNSYVASSYKFSKTGDVAGTGISTTDALLTLLSKIKAFNYSGMPSSTIFQIE